MITKKVSSASSKRQQYEAAHLDSSHIKIQQQRATMQVFSKEERRLSSSLHSRRCSDLSLHSPPRKSILRRTKSMPAHLVENEYTGKPLFWFRRSNESNSGSFRTRLPPHHPLSDPAALSSSASTTTQERPPRPLFGLLRKPILLKMRQRRSSLAVTASNNHEQPFLLPDTRTDSFETASTVTDDYYYYEDEEDCNDETLIDYSDDEDEDDLMDEQEEVLRGLVFLEEEQRE